MKIHAEKDDIYERKTDKRGRLCLPKSEYANKKVEVIVTEIKEGEEK